MPFEGPWMSFGCGVVWYSTCIAFNVLRRMPHFDVKTREPAHIHVGRTLLQRVLTVVDSFSGVENFLVRVSIFHELKPSPLDDRLNGSATTIESQAGVPYP